MKSRYLCLTLAAALVAAVAPTTSAQSDDDARMSPTRGEDSKQKKVFVRKASEITGTTVQNAQGDDVGEIEDLVVEPNSGQIQYAVLSIGGFLGMGDKLYGVPWSKLQFADAMKSHELDEGVGRGGGVGERGADERAGGMADEETADDPEALVIVIDVDKPHFESAPSFAKDEWPDTNQQWEQRINAHYGTQAPMADAGGLRTLLRLEDLIDADVIGQSGDEIGEIGTVAIDPAQGRVAFYVLEFGGALGIGETHYVLPVEMIEVRLQDEDLIVAAPTLSEVRLASAPEYADDDWERMSNPLWLREVYAFWNQDPYWTQAVEAGYRKPDKTGTESEDDERDL